MAARSRLRLFAEGFDLTAPERADQAVGEDDAARLAFGQTLLDELLGTSFPSRRNHVPKPSSLQWQRRCPRRAANETGARAS
jgi:hypothetical protein